MYSARDNKGDLKVCFTFNFKVEYGGHGFGRHFFELPDLKNVTLDIKIIILAHILPEIWKHIEKVCDFQFEVHVLMSWYRHAFLRTARPRKCNIRHQDYNSSVNTS